jgi:hypothetical protein
VQTEAIGGSITTRMIRPVQGMSTALKYWNEQRTEPKADTFLIPSS